MFEVLLKDQIRNDSEIAGMLTTYKSKPAFFFQKSPADTNGGWQKPCYPRIDYNTDMRYDPERKTNGTLTINVWCTSESLHLPEDIEARLVKLINGTFYSQASWGSSERGKRSTVGERSVICAIWNRSDAFRFEMPANIGGNTAPEVFGTTLLFDLMEFPEQLTTDPDPIQGLNHWTRANFTDMTVIAHDDMPPVWKPTNLNPAIYWRFEGTGASDRQSYAANWYNGQFAAHVIADSITERNRWTKAIIERIQLEGEVLLPAGSPMFLKQIAIRHSADPLREGQLLLTGQYGVLAQHRKEYAGNSLNNVIIPNLGLEVRKHG